MDDNLQRPWHAMTCRETEEELNTGPDGLTDEVKVAILAALAQEPGFHLANVTNVSIRRI